MLSKNQPVLIIPASISLVSLAAMSGFWKALVAAAGLAWISFITVRISGDWRIFWISGSAMAWRALSSESSSFEELKIALRVFVIPSEHILFSGSSFNP